MNDRSAATCFTCSVQSVCVLLTFVTLLGLGIQSAAAVTLVEEGNARATIILPEDAPQLTIDAAKDLQHYLEQISGASIPLTTDLKAVQTPARIWVGHREALSERFPDHDFTFSHPEELLIRATDDDLILIGRDEIVNGRQTQAGSSLAVLTFLQDHLNVRWLWPGPWGTDVPQNETIQFDPFEYRYHPQLRYRQLRATSFERSWERGSAVTALPGVPDVSAWLKNQDHQVRQWLNRHRLDHAPSGERWHALRGSLAYAGGHAFSGWWSRFHEQHPEWFALQHDGTRSAYPIGRDVKLCISNPEVAEQWLADAERILQNDPGRTVISASFNDRGWQGFCRCENCRAWDNPQAPILEQPIRWADHEEVHYALTDRYVKFWNILARGLRERFPDKDVNVGVYAYHVTRPAPAMRKLEDNIIVGFVGIRRRNPISNSLDHSAEQRELWKAWADNAHQMVWRPNLMNMTASLPYVFMQRHGVDMNFLADNKIVGIDVDSIPNNWSTQGPQYYVTAQMAWNPRLNVDDILDDYYRRAFGPAAESIANYFDVFEQLYYWLGDHHRFWHRHMDLGTLYRRPADLKLKNRDSTGHGNTVSGPQHDVEKRAAEYLSQARQAVADAPEIYQQRVAFIAKGFEFTQAQLDAFEAMTALRDNADPSGELRRRAEEAAARRERILIENLNNFAFGYPQLRALMQKEQRYYGPPLD